MGSEAPGPVDLDSDVDSLGGGAGPRKVASDAGVKRAKGHPVPSVLSDVGDPRTADMVGVMDPDLADVYTYRDSSRMSEGVV